ncbi:MAG: hypothetical protein R3B13_32745 [Polyangiaceae bacterium]
MSDLVPCTECNRHARASDGACPFCGGELSPTPQIPLPDRRMSRAAVVAFGATLATGMMATGCSSDDDGGGSGGSSGSGATGATGGASGGQGGASGSAGTAGASGAATGGFGGIAPAYGLPADAGPGGAGGSSGMAAAYGLPPDSGI